MYASVVAQIPPDAVNNAPPLHMPFAVTRPDNLPYGCLGHNPWGEAGWSSCSLGALVVDWPEEEWVGHATLLPRNGCALARVPSENTQSLLVRVTQYFVMYLVLLSRNSALVFWWILSVPIGIHLVILAS